MKVEKRDKKIIDLFNENDGRLLTVEMNDGEQYKIWNIAWGYDMGDEFAHVTGNISPSVENSSIDFFYTNDIRKIISEDKNECLYQK